MNTSVIERAAEVLRSAHYAIAFTGAGISLESGIPTFRGGADSLWSKYDPDDLELGRFFAQPEKCWKTIKACFYDFIRDNDIKPNKAHYVLAEMEKKGMLKSIITQNIDALHQEAGATNVLEFHGTCATATCQWRECRQTISKADLDLSVLPPKCPKCGGLMKPDFVFFGESIPESTFIRSFDEARKADVCLVVGTTAQVQPAGQIPIQVHRRGGTVIEINPTTSAVTSDFVDIHIAMGAVDAFTELSKHLGL